MRWVVTGANRGIGLEICRQLAARGDEVEATAREPGKATALAALAAEADGRVRIHALDVRSDESARALAESIGPAAVDVLVNNAGIMGQLRSLESFDLADAMATFDVNALGPIRVTRALLPLLRQSRSARVVHVTSGMGSIGDNTSGGAYGYRMAKAALNMAARSMSVDLRGEGIVSVAMNPGWVKTDMGGAGAPTAVDVCAKGILAVTDGLTLEQSGHFVDYRGGDFPSW